MSSTMRLGKVCITPKGAHNPANAYEYLDVVTANGMSYIAKADVPAGTPISHPTYWLVLTSTGPVGPGVPSGGTEGQMLVKTSETNYDTAWANQAVTDVQINNSSILNNGIANIPKAGANLGTVRINSARGINISDGMIFTNKADNDALKVGTDRFSPIVPYNQDISVYYGLSKVAGVDLANETVTVGTYTDAAKIAIQKMLGLYHEWELIAEYTVPENSDTINITTDLNGEPFALSKICANVWLEPSTTGDSSYISAGFYVLSTNNSTTIVSAPTIRYMTNGIATFADYHGEIIVDQSYATGSASSVPNSTATVTRIIGATTIKYYSGFKMAQYSSASSQIPKDSIIKIYGIRI